ncbi:hypothetical protein KGF57_000644 [Candida theae]|uniref:Uncharacterized protein n=1 Tax=Candida theae TaxID=1198502 RepID=A0AAD5BIU2_9ASCO|nr:uncharacterized protein KGF57_000644 [Candida theae]KAI5966680.1 hypothetical protein KGF57_000644 [Candida theae]
MAAACISSLQLQPPPSSTSHTTTSTLPSPCESCITLNPLSVVSQHFDSRYLSTYLQARLAVIKQETDRTRLRNINNLLQPAEQEDEAEDNSEQLRPTLSNLQQTEITMIYNHQEITIKLNSILSLINTYANNDITIDQLTINHLFLFLFYHQLVLFPSRQQQVFIGQFNIIHLGKSFVFEYTNNTASPRSTNNSNGSQRIRPVQDHLLSELKINQYPKFFLNIRDTSMSIGDQKLSLVEIGNFISRIVNFVDKSSGGQVTYAETLRMKLKRSKSTQSSTTIKNDTIRSDEKIPKRTKFKQEVVRVLHRLYS